MASPSTVSKSVKFGLHFAGVWPGTPLPNVHKAFWISVMGVLQTYQYEYIITHYRTASLMTLIDCFSITVPFTLLCIKLIATWINHGVLRDILSTMDEDCEKYAAIDTNNLISKTSVLSSRLTNAIVSSCMVSAVAYTAGTLAYQQGGNSTTRGLLYKMDLPFDTNESPVHELVVTAQFLHLATAALTFATYIGLLLMAALHVGCNVDILCKRMLDPSVTDKEQVRFFISRQQEIISFVEKIEKLFTYIALSQLLSNTFITCCVGYLLVISLSAENGLPMLMKCIVFYYVICLEAFIYCFVGEFLDIKSKTIAATAFDIPWYNLHPDVSRQVVLLILRAQKGLPLTFGKFSMMNLESFTAVRLFYLLRTIVSAILSK
ncbi:odorant receptor 10-like [Lasioglossum baleicum]|uniref:odorant receptor 10-like n=1 Tax=Lasioglossum baleicum TaxID=434251 RepID=UPI003FCEB1D9